jgi:hypothetical protein
MPFRRMDLREDGTWKAITWPLPKGETRDIPANAVIHSSVIKRMLADPTYRPGNLIVGGGGRGVRRAPKDLGIGRWVVSCEDGHPVGECLIRKEPPVRGQRHDACWCYGYAGQLLRRTQEFSRWVKWELGRLVGR